MNSKQLEESSLKAWPAFQEIIYDGWILRFSEGHTKRANSVNTTHQSTLNLEKIVAHCEMLYQNRNHSPIFRITPSTSPPDLDLFLEMHGYRKIDPKSASSLALKQ